MFIWGGEGISSVYSMEQKHVYEEYVQYHIVNLKCYLHILNWHFNPSYFLLIVLYTSF